MKMAFCVCLSGSVNIARSQAASNNDPTIGSLSGTASNGYCGIHLPVNPLDVECGKIWKRGKERQVPVSQGVWRTHREKNEN